MIYTDDMNQVATYWPPGAPTAAGHVTFGAPVLVHCRWQDKSDLFIDPQGRQQVSSAIVYPDRVLDIQGRMKLGDWEHQESPFTPPLSFIVQAVQQSPDLDGDEVLVKVYL